MKLLNKLIAFFAAVICTFTSFFGVSDADKITAKQYEMPGESSCNAGDGRVGVHDPSIIQSEEGTYYVFGSHGCAAKSNDALNWESIACGINDSNPLFCKDGETLRSALAEPLSWTDAFQSVRGDSEESWQTNVWAADVIYNEQMGKYCYYGSSSVWGTTGSVIWMAVSDNIEGPYEYKSCLVYSGFNNLTNDGKFYSRVNSLHYSFTNIPELFKQGIFSKKELENAPWYTVTGEYDGGNYPNCIDPALFYDEDGQLWMTYGSFFGGIYLMPMKNETGMPDYELMKKLDGYDMYFGKKIIKTTLVNGLTGEGPYIIYNPQSDYYYLFVSYGSLSALGGYNTRVYRSKTVDGPYLDAAGNSALDDTDTGVKLFGNYKYSCNTAAYLSGGHCSVTINNEGKILMSYHTRFSDSGEAYQTRVHQLVTTQDGWLAALPFEFTGESITSDISENELCSQFEFVAHGTSTVSCNDWAELENIVAPTQNITLNADKSISGILRYTSSANNTAVSSKAVNASWSFTEGTPYISFTIDSVKYSGVVTRQTDESGNGTQKLVFVAVGENNECISGVSK